MLLGAHVSSAGGYAKARERGEGIGAQVIQGFSQSPRQWKAPPIDLDTLRADRTLDRNGVEQTFLHATYLINLATGNDELWEKSIACLTQNLLAGTGVACDGVVLHIGSHLGLGLDQTLARIHEAIRRAFDEVEDRAGETSCRLLLENAAGAGHTVGRTFEELAQVIEASGNDTRLGVCFDTQHAFASGIGFDTRELADATVARFEKTIGLGKLGLIHLNDSKVPFGANRDRHENLGDGMIGATALAYLLGHPDLDHVPAVLEVPGDGDGPRVSDMVAARAIYAEGLAARA
jgi:deoxyribonuclease-4